MRRSVDALGGLLLVAGVLVFLGGQRVATQCCARMAAQPGDDLDWLRQEFRLSAADLERVRQLHEGYLPKCREFCARIDHSKQELHELIDAGTNGPTIIEQKLVEIGTLRAQCQAAMLRHFQEVSQAMPPEQGRRYLTEMQRLTLGFHEQVEHAMSPASSPHGHH
jgi:hypothetical protein